MRFDWKKYTRFLCGLILYTPAWAGIVQNHDLFFKCDHTPKAPYVNQQVIYTVKLFQRVPFLNAGYNPPHLADAVFFPLGDAREYHATLHGEMYAVTEQSYAVFPQKSGILSIYGPSLDAFTKSIVPTRIHLPVEISTLHVHAPPLNQAWHWLPAKNVRLQVQDDLSTLKVDVGQALVRTITLSADEIPAELLPGLNFQHNSAWEVYVAKAVYINRLHDNLLHGQATYKVTYILTHPGSIILPAQSVSWFNTGSGLFEHARLPARKFFVLGKPKIAPKEPGNPHKHISIYVYAFVLLMLFVAYFFLRNVVRHYRKQRLILSILHVACLSNQPETARQALMQWARVQFPSVWLLTLDDIMDNIHNIDFKQQIIFLSTALYQKHVASSWNGLALWRCIVRFNQTKKTPKIKKTPLPQINYV